MIPFKININNAWYQSFELKFYGSKHGTMLVSILFLSFFALALIGLPIFMCLGISTLLVGRLADISATNLVQQMYRGLDTFPLLAVPFFILMGKVMNEGKITNLLIDFSNSLVGHIKGALGHINIVVSMLFAGVSGSSVADTAGVGGILIPAMVKEGYSKRLSAVITAASSTLGSIIPPSIMMIVYGATAGISIGRLFLGGAIPGILIGLFQMIVIYYYAKKHGYIALRKSASLKNIFRSGTKSILPLMIPVIIIGGIIGGFFTATEAAMVGCFYSFLLVLFIYKTLTYRKILDVFEESIILYSQPLLCAAAATAFGWMLAYLDAPQKIAILIEPLLRSPSITLIIIAALFLIVGTFMDAIPAIIIFLPIVQYFEKVAGVDSTHMGVVITISLSLGLTTPPYGLCLLLAAKIANISVLEAFKGMIPFYIAFLAILFLAIVLPDLILFLPNMVFG